MTEGVKVGGKKGVTGCWRGGDVGGRDYRGLGMKEGNGRGMEGVMGSWPCRGVGERGDGRLAG